MSHLSSALRALGRGIRYVCIGLGAIVVSGGVLVWADNYQATTGAGTTFASKVISAVNYVQFLLCDATAGTSSCATVSGGALKVDNSAVTQPVSGTVTANLSSLNGAATAANQSTEITALNSIVTNTGAAIPAGTNVIGHVIADTGSTTAVTALPATPSGTNLIGNTGLVLPAGSTPIQATNTGTSAATTATLAADASNFNFVCGISIRANATAASTADATLTGLSVTPLHFTQWTAPNASGIGVVEQIFTPCQPSSAINTAVSLVSAAPGSGGVVSVTLWGFKKTTSP